MTSLRLLCTDLDRTLIPNGEAAELPGARQRFAELINQYDIHLAYVSGRDHQLVQQAIEKYQLPYPEYVIADVGSTIYFCQGNDWSLVADWHQQIGHDWAEQTAMQIYHYFTDVSSLKLQEVTKQGRYKLSYYVPLNMDHEALMQKMQEIALQQQLAINLIYSVDDEKQTGLLDVLPASASKLAAIYFLIDELALNKNEILFAGDSGNDMDVLCSDLPAVLVANARDDVRQQALSLAEQGGHRDYLYLAHGVTGNGHYADGIIEGMQHYYPDIK